ncbi:MAG: hypothetical protein M3281_06255 [Chloroflexota bacterium]|nr:hypothetical protein [Chloroflexota bacterium]
MKSPVYLGTCLLCCVLLTTGCGLGRAGDDRPATAATATAQTADVARSPATATRERRRAAGLSPRQAVIASWRKQRGVRSYRATHRSAGLGTTVTSSIEYVRPDRYHFVTRGKGYSTEAIIIGRDEYSRRDNGAWEKPRPGGTTLSELLGVIQTQRAFDHEMATIRSVKLVGRKVLDGTPTRVYTYRTSDTDELAGRTIRTTSVEKLWVAVSDGLPRRHERRTTNKVGGQELAVTGVTTYRDYNAKITIRRPAR